MALQRLRRPLLGALACLQVAQLPAERWFSAGQRRDDPGETIDFGGSLCRAAMRFHCPRVRFTLIVIFLRADCPTCYAAILLFALEHRNIASATSLQHA